jgi:hypothetical protein
LFKIPGAGYFFNNYMAAGAAVMPKGFLKGEKIKGKGRAKG